MLLGIQFFGSIALLICVGLIYLLYNVLISVNLEYEYALQTVRLTWIKSSLHAAEKSLPTSTPARLKLWRKPQTVHTKTMPKTAILKDICLHISADEDVFFVVYLKESKKYMLLFNPMKEFQTASAA